jgi:hypothetical protein
MDWSIVHSQAADQNLWIPSKYETYACPCMTITRNQTKKVFSQTSMHTMLNERWNNV